jgi:hypothetical protein
MNCKQFNNKNETSGNYPALSFRILHYQNAVFLHFAETLFETEIIGHIFRSSIAMGMVNKIVALLHQLFLFYNRFSLFIERFQYSPVFAEDITDSPDVCVLIAVLFVVKTIAAIVGTEFLIDTSQ